VNQNLARKVFFSVLLTLLLSTQARAASREAPEDSETVPNELIVLLDASPGTPTPEQVVDQARHGLALPGSLGMGSPRVDFLLHRRAQGRLREQILADPEGPRGRLERTIVLRYPSVVKLDAIADALERDPHVLKVERNHLYQLAVMPNDPLFPPTPSPYDHQWGSHLLQLPAAWDYATGNAYVGIIDTGIDTDHEDLQAFRFQNGAWTYLGGNFRPQLSYDYNYDDTNVDEGQPQVEGGSLRTVAAGGHGTHVAGIVAATAGNGLGVAGVCWHCSLMIARANRLEPRSGGIWVQGGLPENSIVEALMDLTDKGAQLINMSFGRETSPDCTNPDPGTYCSALAYAHRRDLVMVAASGNDGRASVDFPAAHPDVVAVGGVIPGGAFWNTCDSSFDTTDCPSNYGSDQELVAPARQVLSTFYLGLPYAGTGCDDSVGAGGPGYGPCTGTSMASPYTTGSAALVRSANPLLTEANVRYLLESRASNNGTRDFVTGYGIPNVSASVQGALGKAGGTVLNNRLTPLFSLYSAYVEDRFYTTVPQMAAAALLNLDFYAPVGPPVPGYTLYPGTQCQVSPCFDTTPTASVYIFATDRSPNGMPLVPLYRMSFKGTNPNGNPNHRDTNYTTETAGLLAFKGVGYELDGTEGYIYKKCTPEPSCMPAGTVRLYRRYNPQRDDFAIFPESELAQMVALGYTSNGGGNEILGYVYPNTDSDGDTLINGFELLAGTNQAVADSDCDGASDGQELLVFGASGYGDPLQGPCGPGQPRAAQFISQTVPASMVGGQTYPVSMTLKNVGSMTWSPIGPQCNAFRLGSTNPFNNTTWGVTRAELPTTVASGGQVTINFSVVAPVAAGTYSFQWQMVQECVTWFGQVPPGVAVSVTAPPPPVANFSFVCTGLSCSFNGASSTGTGINYSWSFGDSATGTGSTTSRTYGASGAYTATLTVTDALGRQSSKSKKVSVTNEVPAAAESFFTVPPCRIADTRTTTPLTSGVQQTFQVTGLCGIPASARAVSFNVTVVSPTGPGFLIFFPGNQTAGPFPHSTINFDSANSPRANNANLRLATNGAGSVNIYPYVAASPGQVHVILDVYGYFSEDTTPAPGAQGPFGFQTLTPCRIADTRTSTPIAVNTTRNFTVQGVCGVPAGAAAAPLNIAVIAPTAGGQASLFKAGAFPPVPTINFNAGVVLANGARIGLAPTTPDVSINFYSPTAGASTHALIDVYGYFKSDAPLKYRPIITCRAVDTRFADQGGPAPLGAPETRNFQIRGNCGVPTSAKAVAVNITSVGSGGQGFLTVYPSGGSMPAASYLNFDPSQGALANGGIVALSTLPDDLAITSANSTHVIIDVFGYFQ